MSAVPVKISIVTPTYNQGEFIEQTICSVIEQNYPNLEYIIIDGGSTDNTVQIIRKFEKYISYWVSEKDNGQAHAINKGLALSTGELFNWLNSDDYLESGALFKIAEAFTDQKVHLVAGKVRNFSNQYQEVIPNQNLTSKGLMCWSPGLNFVQPGVWMRRELIEKCGGIDEQYHYSFDWDLYIRYLYHFPFVKEIPDLLVHFRLHDRSKTQSLLDLFELERRKIIEKLYTLPEYKKLHKSCRYKIEKTLWTEILSNTSKTENDFLSKCFYIFRLVPEFKKVAFTRQTLGALRAFWNKKAI